MSLNIIHSDQAPTAIGPYSQAIKVGQLVYLSGQIPLNPITMQMVTDSFTAQAIQVFENVKAVTEAAGGTLSQIVNLTVLLSDTAHMSSLNQVMDEYFTAPFPTRAAYAVKALPMNADIEVIAVLALDK